MINNTEWKEFNFTDIFEIKNGFYNKKPEQEDNGNIPFIGATDSNNGVTEFYTVENINKSSKTGDKNNVDISKKLFSGNCICVTNNGSVGYAYYQKSKFTCSHDVHPLYLKNYKLNKELAMFLIAAIEKQRVCFTYSRKWRPKRMVKSKILLPVDKDSNPDYQAMEEYIKINKNTTQEKCINFLKKEISNMQYKLVEEIEEKSWKDFKLTDLFEIQKGNQNNMSSLEQGDIPLVSAKKIDNGYKGFVTENNKSVFNGSCITLNNDGDGGAGIAYYQPYKMLLDSHVTALYPKCKLLNKYNSIFVASAITKQRSRFGHGYSINNSRIKNFRFMLPVDSNGNPDYEYMEQYIKNIMLEQYNRYIQFLED